MMSSLVSGNKAKLIGDFRRLQVIHGRSWRKLLKTHNSWHRTEEGVNAWRNAMAGVAGNEVLRQIVDDMNSILAKDLKHSEPNIGPKRLDKIRKDAIDKSLKNLSVLGRKKLVK